MKNDDALFYNKIAKSKFGISVKKKITEVLKEIKVIFRKLVLEKSNIKQKL